jgi:hypothetical protein
MPFECVVLKGLAYFSARPAEGRQLPCPDSPGEGWFRSGGIGTQFGLCLFLHFAIFFSLRQSPFSLFVFWSPSLVLTWYLCVLLLDGRSFCILRNYHEPSLLGARIRRYRRLDVMGTTIVQHHSHNWYIFYAHDPSDSESRTVGHQIAFLGRFKLTELRMVLSNVNDALRNR